MKKLIYILLICFSNSCSTPIENIIEQNKKFQGKWIDSITRLDSVYIDLNKNRFIYSYSIKNHETVSVKNIDLKDKIFERNMENNLKKNVSLNNSEFKIIHEANLDLEFKYYSLDHKENIGNVFFKRNNKSFDFEKKEDEWSEAINLFFDNFMKE